MRKPPFTTKTASRKQGNIERLQLNAFRASPNTSSPVQQAKDRLTIYQLWPILGFEGSPSKSCRCPWREDRKPSFSVSPDGRIWNDFSTGEGGDAVAFLQRALNLTQSEAARRFIELANGTATPLPAVQRIEQQPDVQAMPDLPPMDKGTRSDWVALAVLRRIPLTAIRAAVETGHLRFGEYRSRRSWWVTDSTGRNAHARRMDGKTWWQDGPKSLALKGVQAGWPIGAADIGDKPLVALVEGEPDFLAAWALAEREDLAPVAMLGSGNRIHAEALPFFAGKEVRIYAHADARGQGMKAAIRWAGQLRTVAKAVRIVSFDGHELPDGTPVSDLNDYLKTPAWGGLATADLCPDCWAEGKAVMLGSPFPCQHQGKEVAQ